MLLTAHVSLAAAGHHHVIGGASPYIQERARDEHPSVAQVAAKGILAAGGVGSMTRAMLHKRSIELAECALTSSLSGTPAPVLSSLFGVQVSP